MEDAMLVHGVKKFGAGKWKSIFEFYTFEQGRSSMSLKDRWRTLLKSKQVKIENDSVLVFPETLKKAYQKINEKIDELERIDEVERSEEAEGSKKVKRNDEVERSKEVERSDEVERSKEVERSEVNEDVEDKTESISKNKQSKDSSTDIDDDVSKGTVKDVIKRHYQDTQSSLTSEKHPEKISESSQLENDSSVANSKSTSDSTKASSSSTDKQPVKRKLNEPQNFKSPIKSFKHVDKVAKIGDQESPISKAFNEDNRISHRLRRKKRLLLTTSEGEKIEWDNIIPENSKIQIIKSKNIPKFKRRDWKNWEVLNLEKGVNKYGCGNWETILANYKFEDRTATQLKDKYRNLCKST